MVARFTLRSVFVVTLLLTLAAAVLWIRAAWQPTFFMLQRTWKEGRTEVIRSAGCYADARRFALGWGRVEVEPPPSALVLWIELPGRPIDATVFVPPPPPPWWERMAFGRGDDWVYGWNYGLGVPSWFAVGAPATVTLAALLRLRRERRLRTRRARGLCIACGYDLRGAAHDRCPECGEIAAAPVRV